jgi:hypothetical protein
MKTTMKNTCAFVCCILLFLLGGCKEDKIVPFERNDNPPGQVSRVTVENLAGKAKISYVLPTDQDLLYIKAVYEIRPGVVREIKSSYYANTMELDGFADTEEHEVKLYAVNRSEVASEPVRVTVKPLENPIWSVFRSLQISPDFAGVRITASNPELANVALEILKKDSLGKWIPFLPYVYTSQKDIAHTTRGLDTLVQEFGVTVRDRFLNYTDTVYNTIYPFYEEILDRNLFKEHRLPGDALINPATAGIPTMWDGNNSPSGSSRMLTDVVDQNPQHITIDLGKRAQLSRIKIWNYAEFMSNGNHQFYYRGQLRFFEIWGSDNPASDGSWDSWTKLGTFEIIKPSGSAYGTTTQEDWDYAAAGFDCQFDAGTPKVRFLRIKSIQNWMGTTWFEIKEISVYGDAR